VGAHPLDGGLAGGLDDGGHPLGQPHQRFDDVEREGQVLVEEAEVTDDVRPAVGVEPASRG
jgi:hypothetical protein